MITKLMSLADKAKDRGFYEVANVVFAVLVESYLQDQGDLDLEWETQDGRGEEADEAYFDLAVLRHGEQSICIPAPILSVTTAVTLLKRAAVVERRTHSRVSRDGSETSEDFWAELAQLLGGNSSVVGWANAHLDASPDLSRWFPVAEEDQDRGDDVYRPEAKLADLHQVDEPRGPRRRPSWSRQA